MISKRFLWLILMHLTFLKGGNFQNTTEPPKQEPTLSLTTLNVSLPETSTRTSVVSNTTQTAIIEANTTFPNFPTGMNITSTTDPEAEVIEIIHGVVSSVNGTETTDEEDIEITEPIFKCFNGTFSNVSCSDVPNETLKTNYTIVAEVMDSSGDFSAFRLEKTAAIAAGVFLVSAVIGYISCIGYRRYLQRKYDSGQILIPQEVYDTTDLRYFEI